MFKSYEDEFLESLQRQEDEFKKNSERAGTITVMVKEIEDKISPLMWKVFYIIVSNGFSKEAEIKDYVVRFLIEKEMQCYSKDSIYRAIKNLIAINAFKTIRISTGIRTFNILELTDVGRMLFMKRFLKEPPESEMEKILSAHSSYAHGYMVEEVKNILENRGGFELVSTDRKANRIKLKDDESCIPDVITKDHWGYTFYEVECGTHNSDDFNRKCNKLIQVTRTLMFIGPGRNVVEKKLLPKITGWVKNIKPEFLRANNISIKVASMHDFKQGKWTYSYDMKRGLPVCNIKNSKKKENANG